MTKRAGTLLWTPELRRDLPRYRAIVEALAEDRRLGRLHPGDRLPTQRDLADALGIGLGTVTRAYGEAERLGLLASHVGRGAFVLGSGPSNPLGLPDHERIEMSVDLPMHCADPDLAAGLLKVARAPGNERLLRYSDQAGSARHRRAGAAWIARFGLDVSPDDVVVCSGSQHAICVTLMACCNPGELVLCDALSYPGIRAITRQLGLKLDGVPMRAGTTDLDALASICRARRVAAFYCAPSFHNPTTGCMSEVDRRALAALAEAHDFVVLEDDVHRLMATDPPAPVATFAPARCAFFASFSKAVAGGLRVAFCVPPRRFAKRVHDAVWATVWMASPLPVEVAATWIEDGSADRVVAQKRGEAARRVARARQVLEAYDFDAQDSGFYIWLKLPEAWSDGEFVDAAREAGVAVAPSTAFATDSRSDRGAARAAARICLAAPESYESCAHGLEILRRVLDDGPPPRAPFGP